MAFIYLNNDYDLAVSALTATLAGSPLTAATVTARLYAENRTTAVGSPVSLTGGTGGNYAGVLESSNFSGSVSAGDIVFVRFVATQGGYDYEDWVQLTVGYRS